MLTKFHKGQITDAEFWFEYVEKIYTFDLDQLVEELDNHILLCHCSKDELCHRLMLAFYLHAETGIECEEIGGFGSILTLPFNEVELPVRFNITPETRKEVGLDLPIDDLVGHWRELKKLNMTFLYS
jgi:hypothetical protein